MLSPDDDLAFKAAVMREVAVQIAPYVREVEQIRASAARVAEFAKEDRERLAERVKEDSKREAAEAARDEMGRILKSLGIDTDEPAEFVKRMNWLVEWMEAIGSAKRHSLTVIVTTIAGGILALIWSAFKGNLIKP